jgi:hypothetical protein
VDVFNRLGATAHLAHTWGTGKTIELLALARTLGDRAQQDSLEAAAEWRAGYNETRHRSAIGYLTPATFADSLKLSQPSQLSAA